MDAPRVAATNYRSVGQEQPGQWCIKHTNALDVAHIAENDWPYLLTDHKLFSRSCI